MQVSQENNVNILRLVTANCHDQYQDFKQMNKSVLDVAMRAFSAEVKELLIKLLNEANT